MKKKLTLVENRIKRIFEHHRDNIITLSYSGGKDSTFLLLCTLQVLIENPSLLTNKLHVIYSDTGVEIPELREYVLKSINKFRQNGEVSRHVEFHTVRPSPNDNFFVKMIEEGYPAPHVKFRWCTRVLKTKPIDSFIERLKEKDRVIVKIVGVRREESAMRKMNKGAYEVGMEKSKKNVPVYAPIIDLTSGDVWNGLSYFCSKKNELWGKEEFEILKRLYALDTEFEKRIRHGCWVCTVINPSNDDKALLSLAKSLNKDYLLRLNELKKEIWKISTTRSYRKENKKRKGGLGGLNDRGKQALIELIRESIKDEELKKAFYSFFEDDNLRTYLKRWLQER